MIFRTPSRVVVEVRGREDVGTLSLFSGDRASSK